MTRQGTFRPERLTLFAIAGALAMIGLRAAFQHEAPLDMLAIADNDDIMRFLSVRDLLAGQGWFDMVQYRVLPPEGLPMHWSRYVDAGIAGVVHVAALFVSAETAQAAAIAIWPALVLALLVVVTGLGARGALGPLGAAIAVLTLMVWPLTSYTYFRPARLDHHNVQILLMTAMVLTLVRPAPSARAGIVGGLAAALSLAVGLETVPLVGLAGLLLTVRSLRDPEGDGGQLLAFSGALALGSLGFFAGQMAPATWLTPQCDQLSSPLLALAFVAAAASVALVALARRVSRLAGFAAFCAILATGLVLAAPLLRPCLDGPYATLPPDVLRFIPSIREVRPAHWFIRNGPPVFWGNVAPAIGVVVTGGLVWLWRLWTGRCGPAEKRVAGTLVLFGAVTLAGLLVQVRMIVLTAPVVPLLAGYALAALLEQRLARRSAISGAALILAVVVTLLPPLLYDVARRIGPAEVVTAEAGQTGSDTCREADLVRSLGALPPGRVLSPVDLGPPIALLTGHAVLAGPYHRRPEALANGIVPFQADRSGLLAALADSEADYLVLCRDAVYGNGNSYAAALVRGEDAGGLVPVPGADPAWLVLRPGPADTSAQAPPANTAVAD